jgi:hypothetical protein
MTKKSRRARKRQRSRATPSTSQTAGAGAASSDVSAGVLADQGQPQALVYAKEYRYVVEDLKRVAILAGAMLPC